MSSKQLHKHALPVVILSAGLCLVTVISLANLLRTPHGDSFVQLVTDRQLSVKPASNGLVHISRYRPGVQDSGDFSLKSSGAAPTGLGAVAATGQNTRLDATLAK